MKRTIKTIESLDSDEKSQISSLIKRFSPNASEEYIAARTVKGPAFDVVMEKNASKKILAVSYYHVIKRKTPFYARDIFVAHFGQALKSAEFRGNVIWKIGGWYARKKIGLTFPLRKLVGVSLIITPRVFENFIKLFPVVYPQQAGANTSEIVCFLNHYLQQDRKIHLQMDSSFCLDYPGYPEEDITEDWEKFYQAKSKDINDLFIQKGIIVMRDGRIYKTGKHLVACGYRSFL